LLGAREIFLLSLRA